MPLAHTAAVASSVAATMTRMGRGIYTRPAAARPERPLELYEFEGCPFCRLVREALTELDLDALVHPCPKGGARFRPRVVEVGGKTGTAQTAPGQPPVAWFIGFAGDGVAVAVAVPDADGGGGTIAAPIARAVMAAATGE